MEKETMAKTSGAVSANIPSAGVTPIVAVYTGNSLDNLTQIGCQTYSNLLTFHVNAGTIYYFQIGNYYSWESGGSTQFHLDVAPQPVAGFYFYPYDPSVFDTIQFYDTSYHPGQVGFQSYSWDFGDGTTGSGRELSHTFGDGTVTITLTVTNNIGLSSVYKKTILVYPSVEPNLIMYLNFDNNLEDMSGRERYITSEKTHVL